MTAVGAMILVVTVAVFFRVDEWPIQLGFLAIGTVGTVCAVLGILVFLNAIGHRIVMDRRRGVIVLCNSDDGDSRDGHTIPFSHLAALQLCEEEVARDEVGPAFQVNLVLSQPAGKRIHLLSSCDLEQLWEDMQKLATFLQLPVLNHRPAETVEGDRGP